MSQSDEDVAAVLGVTAADLAPSPPKPSRRIVAASAVGLGLLLLALVLAVRRLDGPSSIHTLERRISIAQSGMSIRHAAPARAAHVEAQDPQAAMTNNASHDKASTPVKVAEGAEDGSKTLARAIVPVEPMSVSPGPTRRVNDAIRVARTERLQTPEAPPEITYEPPAQLRALTWLAEPSEQEVFRLYPTDALANGVSGSVMLSCRERLDGTVELCQVLDETPNGAGFGRAALKLSRNFRFTPYVVDGRIYETTVRIPYEFAVEE